MSGLCGITLEPPKDRLFDRRKISSANSVVAGAVYHFNACSAADPTAAFPQQAARPLLLLPDDGEKEALLLGAGLQMSS